MGLSGIPRKHEELVLGLMDWERLGSQHGKGMSITVDHFTVVLIKGLWWVWTEGERLEEALVM